MVVDPQVPSRALAAGYNEVQRLRHEAFDCEFLGSNSAPRILLKYRIRSILGVNGTRPIFTKPGYWHVLSLTPSLSYPEYISNDDIRFVTQRIFHPNVFPDGRVCIRDHAPSESLGRFALRLAEMIRFSPEYIGADSPADWAANEWCRRHSNELPTDVFSPPSVKGVVLGRVSRLTLGRLER